MKTIKLLLTLSIILQCGLIGHTETMGTNMLANDVCANATTISVGQVCTGSNTNGTNVGAVDEMGTYPNCFGGFDVFDVWYKVTPSTTATYSISTDFGGGTMTDSEIALYSGSCGSLNELACDQDGGAVYLSTILHELNASQTYYIQVSGYGGEEGTFCLQVSEIETLDNDVCSGAVELTVGALCDKSTPNGTNVNAFDEGNAASCFDDFYAINDVWYKFTAPTGGVVNINVIPETGSSIGWELAAYSGSCGTLNQISCSSNNFGQVDINALSVVSGNTYYIQINGQLEEAGNFCVRVVEPLANDACAGATALTPGTVCTGSSYDYTDVGATDEGTVADANCMFDNKDVWFSFVPQTSGWTTIRATSATIEPKIQLYSGTCGTLTYLDCDYYSFSAGEAKIENQILTVGQTYYIQVADGDGVGGTFCIEATERDCDSGHWFLNTQEKVDALANLECSNVIGDIFITGNGVTDLSGFSTITSIGGNFEIDDCTQLTTLTGLENLTHIGGNFNVIGNTMLNMCCAIFPIIENEGVVGNAYFEDNSTNCNTEEEVLENCTPPCPTAANDRDELIAFFNATGGTNWTFTWNLNDPMDTWHGITLDYGGCVQKIELPSNGLTGTIPNLDLPHLEILQVGDNDITGCAALNQLPELEILQLHSNDFTGTVPNFDLPSLEYLMLRYNEFDACPELSNLPALATLDLRDNHLSFDDLLPNIGKASSSFHYVNQTPCTEGSIEILQVSGQDWQLDLGIDENIASNRYRWKKDNNNYGNVLTSNDFEILSLHLEDEGLYNCEITNVALPNLTIYSCSYDLIIQYIGIPDAAFEQKLIDDGIDSESVLDGKILRTDAEMTEDLWLWSSGITDLTGIEGFRFINNLAVAGNDLGTLDLSSNTSLVNLYAFNCNLTALNVTGLSNLKEMRIYQNALTSLDLSTNTQLELVEAYFNNLTSIDVSNCTALKNLDVNQSSLNSLDISDCTALESLIAHLNPIGTLNLINNTALISLGLSQTGLTSLDVSMLPDLKYLSCSKNSLGTLNVSNNTKLITLGCYNANLNTLDVSNNPDLVILSCLSNNLSTLDVSNNPALIELSCGQNNLSALDVSHNPLLTDLSAHRNDLTSLDLSQNPALTEIYLLDAGLESLDLRNNNNQNITYFDALQNPDLLCIDVDNETYATANFTNVEPMTGFSTDCNGSLSVNFLNFQAKIYNHNSVQVHWEVTNEINFSHYEIQRSTDSKNWENIGQQIALQERNYYFVDQQPVFKNKTSLYYRLAMIDLDGSIAYSEVRSVQWEVHQSEELLLFPNPATDKVVLQFSQPIEEQVQSIEIWDVQGRKVRHFKNISNYNQQEWVLSISQIPSGVYMVRLVLGQRILKQRLVVQ